MELVEYKKNIDFKDPTEVSKEMHGLFLEPFFASGLQNLNICISKIPRFFHSLSLK